MTEQEIKKALNICTFGYLREKRCKDCPLDSEKEPCMTNLHLATLEYIKRLESENAALRERLGKAVELPFVPTDYHIETWLAEIKVSLTDESATIIVPVYIYQKFDNVEAAFVRLAELKGEEK